MTVEVKAGDWIVYQYISFTGEPDFYKSRVEKVTAKQVRLDKNPGYAKVIQPDAVIVALDDEAAIEKLLQSIEGANGHYAQRRGKAKSACIRAIDEARHQLDATIAKLVQTDAIEKERG